MIENQSENERWNNYYSIVEGRPPRDTLMFALSKFDEEESPADMFAIDIGCGAGNDSMELMKRGWSVLAIDKQELALQRLSNRLSKEKTIRTSQLSTMVTSFEEITLPNSFLINASYALPFCHPDRFSKLWNEISSSIQYGGRFAGHLFGKNDEWSNNESMFFIDQNDIDTLFKEFSIELLEEKDEMGNVANGDTKYWHLFSIVAIKN